MSTDVLIRTILNVIRRPRGSSRGGLTTHGAPGQLGIMGPLCPCPNSKKPMKKVPGASHEASY
ncbi:unnamed protein product [Staurois parvus]|uniref:Uncharacterized protein n=1 Tax=Staurois parvus TaxID=386267 RepID=A0ABN9G7B2_9NEOB|nr:unnamed protein product [Staurois parvus]